MFQVTKDLVPDIFPSVFNSRNKLHYNLRHASRFDMPLVNSVYIGTEIILLLGSKIWIILPNEIKEMKTVEAFKGAIKNGNQKIARVDFVSTI